MENNWIDVNDDLPNNFDPVQVLLNGDKKSFAVHIVDWHFYSKKSFTLIKQLPNENIVTHWKPIK